MRPSTPTSATIALALLAMLASPLLAQAQEEEYTYRYARPGQATQKVYIWGAVDQPGVWEVAPETDLVELFSVVRPTGYGTETVDTKSEVVVRIHRTDDGRTRVVSETRLGTLLSQGPSQRPTLQAGDVVEVRTIESRKFSFSTVSTIVGTLSSVTLLVLRIVGGR